jgi:hypothetical protein
MPFLQAAAPTDSVSPTQSRRSSHNRRPGFTHPLHRRFDSAFTYLVAEAPVGHPFNVYFLKHPKVCHEGHDVAASDEGPAFLYRMGFPLIPNGDARGFATPLRVHRRLIDRIEPIAPQNPPCDQAELAYEVLKVLPRAQLIDEAAPTQLLDDTRLRFAREFAKADENRHTDPRQLSDPAVIGDMGMSRCHITTR